MGGIKREIKNVKRVLVVMPIILIVAFIAEIIYLTNFNSTEHILSGADEQNGVSMTIAGRAGDTNKWLKRDYDLYGETVDLTAQTIDANFVNQSHFQIDGWQLRFNVEGDVFINQAWCGTMEIHQHVNGEEQVQTLDLRSCTTDDLTLDYLYDGDILIPLSAGDYFIYFPSEKDGESTIDKQAQLTWGMILYYLDAPDLSNYEVTYTFHRSIMDGYNIYLLVIGWVIWIVMMLLYVTSEVTYRRTVKEMELKKSGIRSLSDIYSIIYIINLTKDTLTPIFANDASEKLRPANLPASKQLLGMFEYDATDEYLEVAREFADLSTLPERLTERNTVAFEYISKYYGWCQIRFFAMDRDEEGTLENVIFTIQNVDEEKKEIEAFSNRASQAEHENKAKSVFLANMSHEIRNPINTVIGLNTMILRESEDPVIKSYAKNIANASNMLLSIINGILDMSKLEADKMELVNEEYSFKQVLIDVVSMVKTRAEFARLDFKYEVAERIPELLMGDSVRLKQVITNLITNAAKYTDEGSVTLSVFGKSMNGKVHLLVSVKDTGIGIKDEDIDKLTERFTRFDAKRNASIEGTGIGLNLVTGILELMGSDLHVISRYGEGSEFYFEIDQEVVDETPIGKLDFDAELVEDENYQALFTAKDARLLVVDDNAMNLTVFCELLKQTRLDIDTAKSGAQALRKTAQQPYDLIFMDHMMPDMDGVETLARLREQTGGKNAHTPVIAMTANAMNGAKEEYMQLGFDDFLAKPIQPQLLEQKIIDYVDASKIEKNHAVLDASEISGIELPVISGVDSAVGVSHTGGMKLYLTVLEQFAATSEAKCEELEACVQELKNAPDDLEALKAFRIKIHSMKASANMIGAFAVYGVAAMLEYAAVHNQVQEIFVVVPYFLDDLKRLGKNIAECLQN